MLFIKHIRMIFNRSAVTEIASMLVSGGVPVFLCLTPYRFLQQNKALRLGLEQEMQ